LSAAPPNAKGVLPAKPGVAPHLGATPGPIKTRPNRNAVVPPLDPFSTSPFIAPHHTPLHSRDSTDPTTTKQSGTPCPFDAAAFSIDLHPKMVKIMVMEAAIADVKKRLCELVDRVEDGETVIITRHGKPAAKIVPFKKTGKFWRADPPDDPKLYKGINLDEPILDEIQ
jgi:prevent-host-death family protein